MPKYALDINVYIDAFRNEGKAAELKSFSRPFCHLPISTQSSLWNYALEHARGARRLRSR